MYNKSIERVEVDKLKTQAARPRAVRPKASTSKEEANERRTVGENPIRCDESPHRYYNGTLKAFLLKNEVV